MSALAPGAENVGDDLVGAAERARQWLVSDALPFWALEGRDAQTGAFAECLGLNGEPSNARRARVRVQARQIYVYAHARIAGLFDGADAASTAAQYLAEQGWNEAQEAWLHLLPQEGLSADRTIDAYDHAFCLFAFAWLYRMSGRSGHRDLIERTERAVARLHEGASGYRETAEGRLPRQQNSHMHLFEAFLHLYETLRVPRHLGNARAIVDLFERHFFDRDKGLLREFFAEDWTPAPGRDGDIVEPGHQFEWVWLLRRHEMLSGADHAAVRARLFETAEVHGLNPRLGVVMDEVDRAGGPLKATARLWPQAEYLRALLVRCEDDGDAEAAEKAAALTGRIFDLYLDPAPTGCWIDQISEEGEPLSDVVPASTLYHLFGAFVELMRVAGLNPARA